jgi:serine/threonine protein kinase
MPPIQPPEAPDFDSPNASLRSGRVLYCRYRLEHPLGRGGMGVVWLAHDRNLDRPVALKLLTEAIYSDQKAHDALKCETRRGVELAHPNIVRVHDFVEDGESGAIALEYIDGATLTELRLEHRQGCLEVGGFDAWVAELCRAIEYAHQSANLVHGDLKPANLLISSNGVLKVTDFGVGCALRRATASVSEDSGSLGYMSPQQHRGEPPTTADDIYSIGAILYEALTSKPPIFSGDIALQIHDVIPESMAARRERLGVAGEPIPQHWEETILACLEKEPANRPATAAEIARRLGVDAIAPIDSQAPSAVAAPILTHSAPARLALRERITALHTALAPTIAVSREWLRKRKNLLPGAMVVAAGMVVLTALWPRSEKPGTTTPPARKHKEGNVPAYALTASPPSVSAAADPGGIIIRSEPTGAAVTIDGVSAQPTPASVKDLTPGEHVVAIQLVGFDKTSLPVMVRAGQVTDLGTIALHRSSGTLQVTTDPPGAQILLGERELGRTPLTAKLASGAYQSITAHLDGYVDATFNATVTPDQTVALPPMVLKPEPPRLAISTEPAGVPFQVFPDSATKGTPALAAGVTPATVSDLRSGVYRVVFCGASSASQSIAVTVGERGTTPLHRELPHGTLKVESTPAGAEVFDGEQSLGVTPLKVTLIEGTHVITADLNDRTAKPRTVKLASEEVESLRFDFTTSASTSKSSRPRKPRKKAEESTFTKIGRSIKNLFD